MTTLSSTESKKNQSPLVAPDSGPEARAEPEAGMALCLSGGGYRAMLFHLGTLWRLNEDGLLPRMDRISSVSGGSIIAGVLGMNWNTLGFDASGRATGFEAQVTEPVRALGAKTVDAGSILGGLLLPGSINDKIVDAYRRHLFSDKTLQDLPDTPRFVFNATNLQSGVLWRFEKPYMGDWRVGRIENPRTTLAFAVGASSAFPPVLSPAEMELNAADFVPGSGTDLQKPPYTTDVLLADGGIYDNLGLETAWKRYRTILVSDGGGKDGDEPEPAHDWARQSIRILGLIDNQVRSLRKRQVIDSYIAGIRSGSYWGIRTEIANYGLPDTLPCPADRTMALALTATRLQRLEPDVQERLINWGYAVCDAALRKHCAALFQEQYGITLTTPTEFPYPDAAV